MTIILEDKPYIKYARDVQAGKIVTGEYIKLAVQRYFEWFTRDDIYFDYDDIDKKISFIGKMKHYQGSFAGKPFVLLGWESWVLSNLWCWKYVSDGTRVINKALILMARKNAKTALCAAIALCHVIFDERGAEVDFLANNTSQASIAMNHTLHFAKSLDPKSKYFKRYRNSIKVPKTESIIQVHSADASGKDGFNSSLFIYDEEHSAKNWDLYNVFISSMGMRRNPLAITISTTGFLLQGYPLYDTVQLCKDILKGNKEDDSQFAAIYMIDDEDDWQNEKVWIKANPSLGETVTVKYLRDQVITAKNQAAQTVGIMTKNFNMFCQSETVWIPDEYISKSMQKFDPKDLKDEDCYMGVDLSAVCDLTATAIMFPPNEYRKLYPDKYVFINWSYLPEVALKEAMNRDIYKVFIDNNLLTLTSGNSVDYDWILADQKKVYDDYYLMNIAYDSWNATAWATDALAEGLPIQPYSQSLGNFNRPTKFFEKLIREGKAVILYNPLIRWQFGNVQLKWDAQENCLATDTIVPTPTGFKTINDLKSGDYVFDSDGKPTKVIHTTDIHYGRDCYKINFSNGSEVVCDNTHQWYIETPTCQKLHGKVIKRYNKYTYRDTEWLYQKHVNNFGTHILHTKYNGAVEYSEKTYSIDPYVLGLWLGDGSHRGAQFACEEKDLQMYKNLENTYGVKITKDSRSRCPNSYNISISGGLRTNLKKLNLLQNKHIPEEYFYGSIEQRLELVRGLMDTDGTCSKYNGQCSIVQSVTHKNIIDGLSQILSSLGIKHTINSKDTTVLLQFYTDIRVFNLERKYKRQKLFTRKKDCHNIIKSVEKVPSVPTKCITVENDDHLFLITDKYTVTSNCKPIKSGGDKHNKIDNIIAMIQALGGYLDKVFGNTSDGEVLTVG